MKNITIREIRPSEVYKLEDMLYEAIYQPDENNLMPRTVLEIPEVSTYIKDFGSRKDDYCLIADSGGEKENYAVKLYKRIGFEVIAEDEEDYLMLLKL